MPQISSAEGNGLDVDRTSYFGHLDLLPRSQTKAQPNYLGNGDLELGRQGYSGHVLAPSLIDELLVDWERRALR